MGRITRVCQEARTESEHRVCTGCPCRCHPLVGAPCPPDLLADMKATLRRATSKYHAQVAAEAERARAATEALRGKSHAA